VLPIIFILLDYYKEDKFHFQFFWKKWYLLIFSILFGIINIKAQNSIDFIQPIAYNYSGHQLVTIPMYSFTWYITKFFIPVGLAAKHLYPRVIDGQMNWVYYTSWVWLAILAWCIYLFRKNRLFIVGVVFYALTIGLFIKLIPTGNDIVSERYAYVPYIGLSIAFGALLLKWLKKFPKFTNPVLFLLILTLGITSLKQTATWKDEISIWSRVATIEPEMPLAYFERGKAYQDKKEFTKAISDYKKTILLAPNFYEAYINKGLCNYFEQNNKQALNDFTLAIQAEPQNASAYYHRGNLNLKMNRFKESIADFEQSISLGFNLAEIYYYKGMAEQKANELNNSNLSLKMFLEQHPKNTEVIYMIANNLARMEQFDDALKYYNRFIELNPQMAGAYLNRGNVYLYLNEKDKACTNWNKAIELGSKRAQQMIETYCKP
jgi:tetratricopeptide (TPR) repeat protein